MLQQLNDGPPELLAWIEKRPFFADTVYDGDARVIQHNEMKVGDDESTWIRSSIDSREVQHAVVALDEHTLLFTDVELDKTGYDRLVRQYRKAGGRCAFAAGEADWTVG